MEVVCLLKRPENDQWIQQLAQELDFFVSFFFSSRRRHTRFDCDWSSDVCSSDLFAPRFELSSPEGDADVAISAAWKHAGGDNSNLGAKQGDVYPVGEGFAQDFAHGDRKSVV